MSEHTSSASALIEPFEIDTYNPKDKPPIPKEFPGGYILKVMRMRYGHLQIPYDPHSPESLENAIDEVIKKLRDGWSLFGMKQGADPKPKIINRDNIDLNRDNIKQYLVDNDMLMLTDATVNKVLVPPVMGGGQFWLKAKMVT